VADRSALALAFTEALEETDSDRAGLVLPGGCAHVLPEQTHHGRDAILAAWQARVASRRAQFDSAQRTSAVIEDTKASLIIRHTDRLYSGASRQVIQSQQRLWMDDLGCIWRIEDIERSV
jgi:hypothetical protein